MVPSVSMKKRFMENADLYVKSRQGSEAEKYLESRGITSEVQNYFRIGLVADPGVGDERFAGRISLPYMTRSGIVKLRFRRYPDDMEGAKYLDYFSEESRIYNTEAFFRPEGYMCITEGELDAVAATMAGLPAVGIAGTNAWKPYFYRAFRGFDPVYVLADGDKAGDELARAVAKQVVNTQVVKMPDGHDVNSFFLENGQEGLYEYLGL